jgi:hypothetical protein
MGNPAHRRGGHPGVSGALVVAVLVAFGLGWLGAVLAAAGTSARPAAAPPAAGTARTAPGEPGASTGTPTTSAGAVVPVGFAQPVVTPTGLAVTAVVTKVKGGVLLTLVAQNRGSQPITVNTADLGPHVVTFRGSPVPVELTPQTKKLVPGEALVYSCRVRLPDMNAGEMSFTVAGMPIRGFAAGD